MEIQLDGDLDRVASLMSEDGDEAAGNDDDKDLAHILLAEQGEEFTLPFEPTDRVHHAIMLAIEHRSLWHSHGGCGYRSYC